MKRQLDLSAFAASADAWRQPWHAHYYAAYSSVFDAIVTDPLLMLVPMDDHLVHRGDGVFETFKCVDGALYNLTAHLERLEASAEMIALAMPVPRDELVAIIRETVRTGGRRDCLVRLLVSRGPGSFGVNPRECPRPHLYVAAVHLSPPFMHTHPAGASVCSSRVAAKEPFFARTKNCNYLQNAMMKLDAVRSGADFAACFDAAGLLAEGAAETFGVVTATRELVFPQLTGILAGTTMMRLVDLCRLDGSAARVSGVRFADISRTDIADAAEMLVVGTTIDVTAVRAFDDVPVGDGRPGPVTRHLAALLQADIGTNAAVRLPVFD